MTAFEGTGAVVGADGLARPTWASHDPLLRTYYDVEWGMPVRDERGVYERLSLEAFQAGLSWATILRKRPAFRAAFDDFDPDTVAAYTESDVERLMNDAGIVRNGRKIRATITNAGATIALRKHGGLAELVWSFQPEATPRPRTSAEVRGRGVASGWKDHTNSARPPCLRRAIVAPALVMVARIFRPLRTIPASFIRRSTSDSVYAATVSGSKSSKAARNAGRLRKMVAQDRPAWNASRLRRSYTPRSSRTGIPHSTS